jgi:hypothetical protein
MEYRIKKRWNHVAAVKRPGEWLRGDKGLILTGTGGLKRLGTRTGQSMCRGDTRIRCLWICHTSPRVAIFLERSGCKREQIAGKAIVDERSTPSSWFASYGSVTVTGNCIRTSTVPAGAIAGHVRRTPVSAHLQATSLSPGLSPCQTKASASASIVSPNLQRKKKIYCFLSP